VTDIKEIVGSGVIQSLIAGTVIAVLTFLLTKIAGFGLGTLALAGITAMGLALSFVVTKDWLLKGVPSSKKLITQIVPVIVLLSFPLLFDFFKETHAVAGGLASEVTVFSWSNLKYLWNAYWLPSIIGLSIGLVVIYGLIKIWG